MPKAQLNPKILDKLSTKLGLEKSTVRQQISRLKQKNARCTLNAVAQIYAMQYGETVMQQLTAEDKATLPHIEQNNDKLKISTKPKKEQAKLKTFIKYQSEDHFINGHINELQRAYTYKCYTSVYILARKIIENLIVDILQRKYPPEISLDNKELYWDVRQRRFKDFSVILKNLFDKKDDFLPAKSKAIERLYQLANRFKSSANDKTHSWFHLVSSPNELNDLQLQDMLELIIKIEN
jgi:hypothetical protein